MRRCRRFARPGVRCRCRRARSCRYRAASSDAAPRRRRALAATRGRACALARRHFRVPWVPPVVPCSVPACSSPGSGCSRSVPGQPPPRLGAAMPVAAAAPLISSVQKLVLYETRAVSSVPLAAAAAGPGAVISVPPAAVAQCGRGVQTPPGVLARPCPELLPRLGCILSKTTPYLSFRVLGSGSFWSHIQNIPRTEKKECFKVVVFTVSLPRDLGGGVASDGQVSAGPCGVEVGMKVGPLLALS